MSAEPKPVAVITGGGGDLAIVLAAQFAAAGFHVLAPGRRELDVTSSQSVEAFFAPLERVDLLINNAGITRDRLFLKQSPAEWDAVIDTNLKGAQLCSQAAAALMMRARCGHIVNVGSYSAVKPPLGQAAYAASKAGLIGLTKSYALELGKRNIRSNCVLPGFLETRMTAPLSDAVKEAARAGHALKRFNTVEEAARFIVFLQSSPHISGQVFQLDSRV
ncbi:MAG: SDR family oxidoreductase [Verrucomicrobiales bacterium]|nr:SDR family oxidoreductase [Verrucomicrobiales bacterium]